MNQFRIVFTVLVVCISSINGQLCPTGISSIQDCSSRPPCPSDSICYRNDNAHFCCGALDRFCPTKMHAFNTREDEYGSYLWGPARSAEKDKWYNVELGSDIISCLICLGLSITFFILHRKSVVKETELPTKTETTAITTVGPYGMYKPKASKTSKETTTSSTGL